MSFSYYILIIMYAVIFIQMLVVVIWRITCFFKKSCTWKKCPCRHEHQFLGSICWPEGGCDKFPLTQEELDEEEKMLDQLDELIEQLGEENKRSGQ